LGLLLKPNFHRFTQQRKDRGPQPHTAGEDARDQHPRVQVCTRFSPSRSPTMHQSKAPQVVARKRRLDSHATAVIYMCCPSAQCRSSHALTAEEAARLQTPFRKMEDFDLRGLSHPPCYSLWVLCGPQRLHSARIAIRQPSDASERTVLKKTVGSF
jgi:hypothetical protein